MFLASDRLRDREQKVRSFLRPEPGVAMLVAAVNFEWTVTRAVLFLSQTPNRMLRKKMADYYSPEGYKNLWKAEVMTSDDQEPLSRIVRNWSSVLKAFKVRNLLIHGKDRCTTNMATPHVEALLKAVAYIDAYCISRGIQLHCRVPVRRSYSST